MVEQANYQRIKTAMEFIGANMTSQPSVEEIAAHIHLSQFHFQRIFKAWAGISPKKFLQYITLHQLKKNIHHTKNIFELSDTVGLSSQSRVYDLFVNFEAVTPHEYKHKGAGIDILYGFHDTPFGECLIANTTRGICALDFVDDDREALLKKLHQKWTNANIRHDQTQTAALVPPIFKGSQQAIKTLVFGTPFQVKIWEALVRIPFGDLVTYSSIARHIDQPNASRAVGTAIGKNNIAYLIPCHRVIRTMGGLGGYKWTKSRKLSLIGWEAARK